MATLINELVKAGMTLADAKTAAISITIKGLTDAGIPAPAAFDLVLGEGAYVRMAGDLYDRLRAQG